MVRRALLLMSIPAFAGVVGLYGWYVASRRHPGLQDLISDTLRRDACYKSDTFSISVKNVRGRTLIRPFMTWRDCDGSVRGTAWAQEADFDVRTTDRTLLLNAHEVHSAASNGSAQAYFEYAVFEIPLVTTEDPSAMP
ncbi:hypothetical protein AYO40_03780 [Planctomycetaceae bacterium SCGC AG-212-D15]|nr:hypothetical protein AYO40_03780 [Planctomycetaceae bacterium SCGC AG-212-D15]